MTIKEKNGALILTGEHVTLYHMLAQKHALRAEIKGLRFSGGSVSALLKRTYGLKGRTKVEVLAAFEALIDEKFPLK